VKIQDFASFRDFLPLANKYSSKFEVFKYETAFEFVSVNNEKQQLNESKSFKESFIKWLDNQQINQQIKDILINEIG
jgi:hypothetical protein